MAVWRKDRSVSKFAKESSGWRGTAIQPKFPILFVETQKDGLEPSMGTLELLQDDEGT